MPYGIDRIEGGGRFSRLLIRKYDVFVLLGAVLYGLFFSMLPLEVFKDRLNYLNYAENSQIILASRVSGGLVSFLANEPLWILTNIVLRAFLQSSDVITFLIFASSFVCSFFVLRHGPKNLIWLLLILCAPQVYKNYVIHLRQGFALSIFLVALMVRGDGWRLFLMLLAPLVHSSFFLILLIYIAVKVAEWRRLDIDVALVILFLFGLTLALALRVVAEAVGARQFEVYKFASAETSGLGFILWLSVFWIFLNGARDYLRGNYLALGVLVFYLTSYFLVEVSGRVFESGIILVLLAALNLEGWRGCAYKAVFLVYFSVAYLNRLGEPWLGFAA